jgi:quercetin dioxygenase-like cupin family protein
LLLLATAGLGSRGFAADGLTIVTPTDPALKWNDCGDQWPKGCEYAEVWGDENKSGSYVRAPKGYRFVLHSHTSPERMLIVSGRVAAASKDGKEAVGTPGMYMGFDGSVVHWARCDEACVMYITYEMPYDVKFH